MKIRMLIVRPIGVLQMIFNEQGGVLMSERQINEADILSFFLIIN
jgi:hypothetical protein